MIAPISALEADSRRPLPNSRRVYEPGQIHPEIRVPMREISLHPTKGFDGKLVENEPVRVYDTSGPWGDPEYTGTVEEGLPPLRRPWILQRGDVEEYDGRPTQARDNGYLSEQHAEYAAARRTGELSPLRAPVNASRRPLRACAGHPVTQLWYARQGFITPEMEFIALRENMRRMHLADLAEEFRIYTGSLPPFPPADPRGNHS
jgi:phosphomethylpyrimidine synthase